MAEPSSVGSLVAALRHEVNLSQAEFARRAGIDRVRLVHLEAGRNQGTSHDMRLALARGFGFAVAVLDGYLAGRLTAAAALARRRPSARRTHISGEG